MNKLFIYSFLAQVEATMRYVWLVEIMGSSLLLCLSGYYIIMVIMTNFS